MGEMHGKKIVKIYELAMKTGAPVIGLIDSTGVRLEEATDALAAFGEIYAVMAKASGVIPQITAVMGNCGGGLALVPAMSDFTFMEEKDGKLFVNAPNTVDGNHVDKCDTSAVDFQSEETGLVDVAASEEEIYGKIRTLVSLLPANNEKLQKKNVQMTLTESVLILRMQQEILQFFWLILLIIISSLKLRLHMVRIWLQVSSV